GVWRGVAWAAGWGRSGGASGRVAGWWKGADQWSRAVSGRAWGANRARSVAGMLAWSWIWVSTVPARTRGETTTAGTRGPSMVKSNAAHLRYSSARCTRPTPLMGPPGLGTPGRGVT